MQIISYAIHFQAAPVHTCHSVTQSHSEANWSQWVESTVLVEINHPSAAYCPARSGTHVCSWGPDWQYGVLMNSPPIKKASLH